MNNVILIGNLVRDPELRYTTRSTAMCRFTLAVSRGLSKDKKAEAEQQGKPTADFISCQAWGKTAELVANYLSKGRQTAVQGRIQTSSYEGQDGNRVYRTDVVVERIEFIGSNESNQGNDQQGNTGFNDGFGDDAFPMDSEDVPF